MKKLLYIMLLGIICCLQSCELSDDSELRDHIKEVEPSELLSSGILQVAFNHSAIGGRSSAVIMQYMEERDASIQPYKQYNLAPSFFDRMWTSGYYSGSLVVIDEMQNLANESDNTDLVAIAQILKAHEFATLTHYFGDIPFSEAVQGEAITTPKYDSQEVVISGIITMLDEAIELIGNKQSNDALSTEDLIYQGDLQHWKKLANGLKARYLFNSRNQNVSNDSEIISLINNSFADRSEQASFSYSSELANPQYTFPIDRPSTLKTGDYFFNLLSSTQDPRQSVFTTLIGSEWDYFAKDVFVPSWFEEKATIPLLSYTELLFMKAELSLYQGAGQSEVQNLLIDAITSSFADNDIDLAEPTQTFISTISNLDGLDNEEVLELIVEQSYIAYYGYNHQQAWNNYRRTGYPAISSTATNSNVNNPSNSIPVRYLYPSSEVIYNASNHEDAKARQGGALLDTKLWMFE